MTYKKQSKSARIRKMLEQGKSVKQIVAAVGCTAQMVYLTRSNMKKKAVAQAKTEVSVRKMRDYENAWDAAAVSTSKKSFIKTGEAARKAREDAIRNAIATIEPKDYVEPKRGVWPTIKRFFLGA